MRYHWRCDECGITAEVDCKIEERDSIPDIECGCVPWVRPNWIRSLEGPRPLRVSYLDGNNRFRDMKEASKLNKDAAGASTQEEKAAIKSEIKRMKVQVEK